MKKQFKIYGKTIILSFNREDCVVYGIQEGDVADLSQMQIIKKE